MSWSQKWRGGGGGSSAATAKPKKPCMNPKFEEWLIEWREEAVQKNSKMQYVYAKALASLRKYPLPLNNGRECLLLEFFGPGLAKMIDSRMAEEGISPQLSQGSGLSPLVSPQSSQDDPYKKPVKKRPKKQPASSSTTTNDIEVVDLEEDDQPISKKPKKPKKAYVPAFRSGAYALLVAIGMKESKPGYRGYMTKSELVQESQSYCDSSLTRGDNPGSNYTAWNSMGTLLTKELILKHGNPSKYVLTPEGRCLSAKILQADHGINLQVDSQSSDDEDNSADELSQVSAVPSHRTSFEPGRFEVVLYVDTSETTAKCKKDEVIGELRKNGVPLEVIRLSVGDFVWVCREKVNSMQNRNRLTISRNPELILPYVVERKRSDDLAGSIKDGRFHEQKFRLQQTGLDIIYLIESHGQGDWGLADGALSQAVANTQMTNQFLIQETSCIKDTCGYLTHMTRHLSKMFENKHVSSCTKQEWPNYKDLLTSSSINLMTFSDFNDFGVKQKNWTVMEMFARQIMRLRGLSVERASAIVQIYPTLRALLSAYDECETVKERELLLSRIQYGVGGKAVGPAISKTIYKLYNSDSLV